MDNSNSSSKKEKIGKKYVICSSCKKGVMVPLYPEAKINHCYKCNYCGRIVNIDMPIEIK